MKLIINADDLGLSPQRDRGIITCARDGVLSSASLIVNGLSCESGVRQAKAVGLPLGLHFNITEGRAVGPEHLVDKLVSKPAECNPPLFEKSFSKDQKVFCGKLGTRKILENCCEEMLAAVESELKAQIDRFIELTGENPTHVDGHQHIHLCAGISELFADTLLQKGINKTRIPHQTDIQNSNDCPSEFLLNVNRSAHLEGDEIRRRGLQSTQYFIGLNTMGAGSRLDRICSVLKTILVEATETCAVEWMVHPGYIDSCWDDFNCSKEREVELELLLDTRLREFLSENKIQLCSFRDL